MERRKDNKGKVLKEGESQRKDGLYQYRWTDRAGKRRTVYAGNLKELRDKKENIAELNKRDIDLAATTITVMELAKRYSDVHKLSLKTTSTKNIDTFISMLEDEPFSNKSIASVTTSDAKLFMKGLYESGYCYGTLSNFKGFLRPAFELACDDRLIARNPFGFTLAKIIPKEEKSKTILSEDQYNNLIKFCKSYKHFYQYVDELIILYETGLRVSEFCGLTLNDVDFKNNTISVTHQLVYLKGKRFIQSPKTKKGTRIVPLSAKARAAFEHLIKMRPPLTTEPVIDGYSGFFQVTSRHNPRVAPDIALSIKRIIREYNKAYPQDPLPSSITPHTFRHTFCTRMIESGMNIKAVQYMMGHSKVNVTLDIYSHIDEQYVANEFNKIAQ